MPDWALSISPALTDGVPFGTWLPQGVEYVEPARGPRTISGYDTWRDTRVGLVLRWSWIPMQLWSQLYQLSGGDSSPSQAGYVRALDYWGGPSGDQWRDFRCIIHKPRFKAFFAGGRTDVSIELSKLEPL